MKKKLYVIDGHALSYRAYYALIRNPLINSKGQNTSAIFGFARMLMRLIQDQNPDYLIVAFDPPGRSFRFDTYKEYKANRSKMPDDLRTQIDEIKRMVEVMGITRLEVQGFEADDVLGTLAKTQGSKDCKVMLVTGDKDAYQLVNKNVEIYANKKGISDYELYDEAAVKEKLGITPEQVIDYMALMGDSSDNVPGVRGIGEKTALQLIATYGSLDNVYEHLGDVTIRQKKLLEEGRDDAYLSQDLVTIRTDVDFDLSLDGCTLPEFSTEEVRKYFDDLEMSSIVADYFEGSESGTPTPTSKIEAEYKCINSLEELDTLITEIKKEGACAWDTETTSISAIDADLVGMSFSCKEGTGYYLPLVSAGLFSEQPLDPEAALVRIKPLLEDENIKKIGQNIKYDAMVVRNRGIHVKGIHFDTMLAAYVLNPEERRYNMDDLALRYLNYKTITFEELVGKGKKAIPITEVPLEDLSNYASEDADITWRLYKLFEPRLKEENLNELYYDLEMPLIPVLVEMEYRGVKLDLKHFAEMASTNDKLLIKTETEIYDLAEGTFNINSTRELAGILFDKLGLKPVKKTKTGYSTDISVLEALRDEHEIIEKLITYRTLAKLKSTYIDTLPKQISERTGRIHTSYNQTIAATGRLSSTNPNLQNIPIRDDFGRHLRKGFVADEGFILMSADYSQIELRLAAHISQDENMMRAFKEGIDIHNMTAASVFGVDLDKVEPEMRRQAKTINFATIYGVSPFGLSQQADISIKEAGEFIRLYFETYPGFKKYIDDTIEFAQNEGYVKTLCGRKRPILEIDSTTSFRREGAERVAINTPLQGTSADLIKIAMINIEEKMMEKNLKSRMILQVHDELVFEVSVDEQEIMGKLVKENMEKAMDLSVPLDVEMGWGPNWEEAH